ncbi:hypothetical protein [Nocardioides aestuarii]|uniref:SnoaL-like domain-containing protein n=1 Tax=Nocardioides aestuarii TaxID=252231 RepID=A0ABW4TTV1_9ACTN
MPRTWVVVALLVSAAGCALVAAVPLAVPASRPAASAGPVAAAAAPDRTAPLAVLRAWDAARSEAWVAGDVESLAGLYARGSRSGRADRRLLAAYDARGLRVHGLGVQRASVEVVRRAGDRLVLLVTDRLTGGWVSTASGERVDLPRDRWSTRRVVLAERGGEWRVVEVRDRGGPDLRRPPR